MARQTEFEEGESMTRDEVLEEAARALEGAGGRLEACGFDRQAETVRMDVLVVRALKSKPPEKSPEVGALTVREACRRRVPLDGADAEALEHALTITERERDELRLLHKTAADAVAELAGLLEEAKRETRHWEAEWLQATMEAKKVEQRAAEATARVEALTAEVRDHEWRENGAKMEGES